jgi:hypothetical protein
MTTLVFDHLSETVDLSDQNGQHPAYSGVIGWGRYSSFGFGAFGGSISSSGQYAYGGGGNEQMTWIADLTVPELKYKHFFGSNAPDYFRPLAIDDEGTLWGYGFDVFLDIGAFNGEILSVDLATQPTKNLELTLPDSDEGALMIFPLTLPDTSIKLVFVPNLTAAYYLGTKGSSSYTTFDSGLYARWAFQDDNGDIWIAETPRVLGAVDSMTVRRITNVTGTSPYTSPRTFAMPSIDESDGGLNYTDVYPRCFFSDGHIVGGWIGGLNYSAAHYLFRANPNTGDITTRNVGSPGVRIVPYTTPDPAHWYVMPVEDITLSADDVWGNSYTVSPRTRVFREIDPATLNDTGTEWNLDAWSATGDNLIYSEWYVDGLHGGAFVGCLDGLSPDPDTSIDSWQGDLFIYYFDGGGGGGGVPTSQSSTVRVWGFMLDGHEFYVLRLGTSETLVYDRFTKQWSQWTSRGFDYWRAHIGGNWQGMTETLADGRTDVVAGDDSTGVLWRLDPLAGVDDNTSTGTSEFTRMVIGGIPLDGREVSKCNAVTLSLSLGNPSLTGAQITLRTSDNQGHDWISHGSVVTTAGSYDQVVEWRALGLMKAPGRVFELSDNGAAVRISSADMR